MGCIAKYYINEDTVIGVWRIEETIRAMARMVYLDDFDKRSTGLSRAFPGDLNS